jgi:hypothetical protein
MRGRNSKTAYKNIITLPPVVQSGQEGSSAKKPSQKLYTILESYPIVGGSRKDQDCQNGGVYSDLS